MSFTQFSSHTRITFVLSSLVCGGAERVAINLIEALGQQGYSISLITIYSANTDFYAIPAGVERIALDLASDSSNYVDGFLKNFRRIRALRLAIQHCRSEILVAFQSQTNILTLFASLGMGLPVIISEQSDPSMYSLGWLWTKLRRMSYSWAGYLVSASRGVDSRFNWMQPARRMIISNSLPNYEVMNRPGTPIFYRDTKHYLMAMGRLSPEKGYDLLISAFSRLAAKYPSWNVYILGEGSERGNLEKMIGIGNLQERIFLPGAVSNPFPTLREADIFVLTSHFEGFGNVLIEAMACGLPVISFDCPSGPREIIRDGVDGILVPPENVDALAAAMDRLMSDEVERNRLAARAVEVKERFGIEKIVGEWGALFEKISQQILT